MMGLLVEKLRVEVDGKRVLKGVDLVVNKEEVVVLMGPNGSGKSSLAMTIAGHPKYKVVKGDISFKGRSILDLSPDERAKTGLLLAFQYPVAVEGVTVREVLLTALRERGEKIKALDLKKKLEKEALKMGVSEELLNRGLNDGFSGGEKKKMEILLIGLLKPELVILDETDSGLDIDALKMIAKKIEQMKKKRIGILVITHYERLLKLIKADKVLVMKQGRMVARGGKDLVEKLEKDGYEKLGKDD